MVVAFSQKHPELRGRLFATFSETVNALQGANRLALGLIRGTSDLIFITPDRHIVGIEVKAPKTRHSASHVIEQCDWLDNNCYKGYFCVSVEMFWDIINGGVGLETSEVRKMCGGKKSVMF